MSYVELVDHSDYEILNEYPFTIRRKRDQYVISEWNTHGYILVSLNGKTYRKHRLIAKQFIPNDDPEHKTDVDHINRVTTDYHLSNLRWVTPSQNSRNRTGHKGDIKYEFVDDIPEDSMIVDFYDTINGHHEFENYYFHDDIFYFWTGVEYRKLHICESKSGNKYVNTRDVNHKVVAIMYSKFKQQHDLI
ncbi:hypothetical protein M9Y10_006009 [Tritrichomonas musculus]|uniref:HNH nuclease domain-containing protein n=1 Tax=Tritrichomonas musculus TaxID=1915356 RepID=A0ABR2JDM7_9EUKA